MQHEDVSFRTGFRVSVGNARSQGAVLVLPRGGKEGGPDIRAGSMVLIEKGDRHEIRNTGRSLLKTVSVHLPPAYARDGDELPAGKA